MRLSTSTLPHIRGRAPHLTSDSPETLTPRGSTSCFTVPVSSFVHPRSNSAHSNPQVDSDPAVEAEKLAEYVLEDLHNEWRLRLALSIPLTIPDLLNPAVKAFYPPTHRRTHTPSYSYLFGRTKRVRVSMSPQAIAKCLLGANPGEFIFN